MILVNAHGERRLIPTPVDPFDDRDSRDRREPTEDERKREALNDLSTFLGLVSALAFIAG